MTIKDYYNDLKLANDLMTNDLHHELLSVLAYMILSVEEPEQRKTLIDFYKKSELPFAKKGSEIYLEISRLSNEVLGYVEENLL